MTEPRPAWLPIPGYRGPRTYDGRTITHDEFRKLRAIKLTDRASQLTLIGCLAIVAVWFTMLDRAVLAALPPLPRVGYAIVQFGPPALVFVFTAWFQWYAPTVVRERRWTLRTLGHATCAHCGYDLAGADPNEGRCPECGRDLAKMPPVISRDAGDAR